MNIDATRLTRDYIEQPLGKLEKPSKEDLEYLFKELNMTIEDLTNYFNKGKSSVGRWLTKYDIKKGTPQTKYVELTEEELTSVDLSRMSRDFQAKPWVPHKDIPVESDFKYLYLELNWSGEAIATYLGVSTSQVRVFLRNFGITKDTSLKAEVKEKELQRKYGVSHVSHIEGVKEKKEQTCLKNHGVKYILEKEEIREGRMEEIYGNKHALCVPELKKKQEDSLEKTTGRRHVCELQDLAKEGVMKKHGVDNVFKLPEFQEKAKETKIQLHGTSINMHVDSIKNKVFETNEKLRGFYGSPFGSKQVREKAMQTTMRNWGVPNSMKSPVVRAIARRNLQEKIKKFGITAHPSYAHVLHKEHFNKEYWLENFVDTRLNCFKVAECATYHGVKLNCINQVLKTFGITMRHKRMSIKEADIRSYIESLGFNCKSRDKTILKPKELDILIPEEKLAIEYDGVMYHSQGASEKYGVEPKYHLEKTKGCESQGIQLLHIFENEWLNPVQNSIWKSVISHKLGCNDVVYARKTVVKEITSAECFEFCEKNHLQGGCRSSKNYGLFTADEELVAIMSFRKPRFNKDYEWELIRYCSKKFVSVVGGASKLLKHFRKLNTGSIISYANRRWSTGELYEALGFSFVRETAPNYFYYETMDGITPKSLELHSRLEFQKHKLANKLANFDANKTEFENMYLNGYRSIYDCGNLVYALE